MSGAPTCSVAPAVQQALDDVSLPHVARLMMWHLNKRLDGYEFREVKLASLAAEMRVKETTAGQTLALLHTTGYLDMRQGLGRTKAYRLQWSRRQSRALAA
ncbi:MAG: hypothetical protein ACK5X3_17770 [Pseudomonadota bacterium]